MSRAPVMSAAASSFTDCSSTPPGPSIINVVFVVAPKNHEVVVQLVSYLMRDDGNQLRLIVGGVEHFFVEHDLSARQRKRVLHRGAGNMHTDRKRRLLLESRDQPGGEVIEMLEDFPVGIERFVGLSLGRELFASSLNLLFE